MILNKRNTYAPGFVYLIISIVLTIYASVEAFGHSWMIYPDLVWLCFNSLILSILFRDDRKMKAIQEKKTYFPTLDSKVIGHYDGMQIHDKLLCSDGDLVYFDGVNKMTGTIDYKVFDPK